MRKFMATLAMVYLLFGSAVSRAAESLTGLASFYGRTHQGKRMANGRPFDRRKLTAACRRFPLGALLLVKFNETGRSVVVTLTDRGPFVKHRELDLSEGAAIALGLKRKGVGLVSFQRIEVPSVSPELPLIAAY